MSFGRLLGHQYTVFDGLAGMQVEDILDLQSQADGSMRVLTSAGIGWFVEGRCIERVTEIAGQSIGRVYDMATDTTGTTWLATQQRGIISLDGRRMSAENGAMQWPWKFAQDASGPLWIGTMGGLACLEDGRIRLVETGHKVSALAIDRQGQVWRGSPEGKVIKGVGMNSRGNG